MTTRIAINGFGRIGRTITRALFQRSAPGVELVAINDLTDVNTLAHLLKYDSVHGRFQGTVDVQEGDLVINGKRIRVTAQRDAAQLAWGDVGVDLVLECTGVFRGKSDASKHLDAGARKVIISAPAKEVDATIVVGVNEADLKPDATVISCGSCTTNCLAPVAMVLNRNIGIVKGLMTTIHAYTSDQRLLDAPHSDLRRARSAGLSMVPTSTGAAAAIGLVLPELKGKLDGMAMRVPTPNVSIVDLTFEAARATSVDEINGLIRAAAEGPLKGVLAYETDSLVSIDLNGNTHSSIFDAQLTTVQDGNLVKVFSWYDNESGFSNRMIDLAEKFAAL